MSLAQFDRRVWLIGCGNMAGAMLSRWLASGFPTSNVLVVRPSGADFGDGVRVVTCVPAEPAPDILLLGMKPQQLAEAASGLQAAASGATVVSILAGTRTATLAQLFPGAASIVRAMPNMPVAIGKGVVALHGAVTPDVEQLMAPLGLVETIADEALFDAVTALSGSGPAFLYRFVAALAKGGAALGLPGDQALRLALATVEGAAMVGSTNGDPHALADAVTSKGGSTRAGLDILDGELDDLVARTLAAAARRNAELASG